MGGGKGRRGKISGMVAMGSEKCRPILAEDQNAQKVEKTFFFKVGQNITIYKLLAQLPSVQQATHWTKLEEYTPRSTAFMTT